jgi:hypothetical protein
MVPKRTLTYAEQPFVFWTMHKGSTNYAVLLILMSVICVAFGAICVICGQVIIFFKEFYMKKTRFALGMLIIGMAFSLVLAGCATTGGTEDPTTEELAAQLAADINAMEGQSEGSVGSTEVNGATVTITGGFVDVRIDLTVPAGVTLDVTEDGYLGLHDVILTVNGTVNANSNHVRLEDTASWATINGSGTIYLKGKGNLLEASGNKNLARKLTLNGVTLVGVKDNDQPLVVVRNRNGNSGELVMKSGAITGNTNNGEGVAGGGVAVHEGGTFTMEGGTISGNSAEGGENTYGGGVYVNKGTFTMEGGEITGNSVQSSQKNASGGGISIYDGGMFTLSGGTICGISVQGVKAARGGGVYLIGAMFTMSGGTISDNRAKQGGGVLQGNDSTFTMKGGTISGNTATEIGGGVRLMWMDNEAPVTFIMEGGTIYGRAAEGGNANTAPASNNDAALSPGGRTAKWGTGGTYTKGGVSQTGGSDIGGTDDTLIATPAQ